MPSKILLISKINLISNIVLFVIKIVAGFFYSCISLLSDSMNSFLDILSAILIYYSIKISLKKPDKDHHFGHTRAENIGAYSVGIIMLIMSLSIVLFSIKNLITKNTNTIYSYNLFIVIFTTFIIKLSLFLTIKNILKRENNMALKANMQDHLNDIFLILGVFVATIFLSFGVMLVDAIIGILIGIYIFYSGYIITKENYEYLMGKSNNDENFLKQIYSIVKENPNITQINDIKTQYFGSKIYVDLILATDKNLDLRQSNRVIRRIKRSVEVNKNILFCNVQLKN